MQIEYATIKNLDDRITAIEQVLSGVIEELKEKKILKEEKK